MPTQYRRYDLISIEAENYNWDNFSPPLIYTYISKGLTKGNTISERIDQQKIHPVVEKNDKNAWPFLTSALGQKNISLDL